VVRRWFNDTIDVDVSTKSLRDPQNREEERLRVRAKLQLEMEMHCKGDQHCTYVYPPPCVDHFLSTFISLYFGAITLALIASLCAL